MGTGINHTGRRPEDDGARCADSSGRRSLVRPGDERGSILIMFALFVVGFVLLSAIVVDVGYWWLMGRKTQIAADACALAAASQLPANWTPARTECVVGDVDYVKTNLPANGLANEPRHISTSVKSPYPAGPNPGTYVEAQVSMVVRTFFGRVVGLDYVTVSRRAVAEKSQGTPGNYAIYSHSSSCSSGLEFDGNNRFIDGLVHSNGQYLIGNSGSPFWAKTGTRAVAGCGPTTSSAIRFGGTSWATATPGAPAIVGPQTWPEWFTPGDFTCTVNAQKIEISGSDFKIDGVNQPYPTVGGQKVIPNGTYCATELFQVSGNDIRGQLTVLSPKIEVNGNNIDLTSLAPNGVLFYNLPNITPGGDGGPGGVPPPTCSPLSVEMKLSNGNGSTWRGKVFHPCERVLIDGNSTSSIEGAIYGLRVKINGNGFNMIGTGGAGGATTALALVE
jgi:hypothetical protein